MISISPSVRPSRIVLRHHPEGGPCSFSLGQFQTGFKITVFPAFFGVHTDGIDRFAYLLGDNAEDAVFYGSELFVA